MLLRRQLDPFGICFRVVPDRAVGRTLILDSPEAAADERHAVGVGDVHVGLKTVVAL